MFFYFGILILTVYADIFCSALKNIAPDVLKCI